MIRIEQFLEAKSFDGIWWEADKPDRRYVGQFFYDHNKHGRLELISENDDGLDSLSDDRTEITFHGNSMSGPITIFKALSAGAKISLGKMSRKIYYFWFYCTGNHIPSYEALAFESVSWGISNLEAWRCDILLSRPSFKEDGSLKYSHSKLPDILLGETEQVIISIVHPVDISSSGMSQSLEAAVRIKIASKNGPISYYSTLQQQGFESLIDCTSKFLAFFIGRDAFPYRFAIIYDNHKVNKDVIEKIYPDKSILFPDTHPICGEIFPSDDYMLFSYSKLRNDQTLFHFGSVHKYLTEYFSNWLVNYDDKITIVIHELLRSRNLHQFSYAELALLIFAFEGFHRRCYSKANLSPLLDGLRKDISSLCGKSERRKEITMRERLYHALTTHQQQLGIYDWGICPVGSERT